MPYSDQYRKQVDLLVRILPYVADQKCFALKGGTAINLFVRDMPRLSVDIDLVYLPVKSRGESLAEIDAALKEIAKTARSMSPAEDVVEGSQNNEGTITKLFVRGNGVQVTVEVTPVLRGCVFDPEIRSVSSAVEESFGFAQMQVVSFADLYGGKIIAALDRQHPRDLFDVRDLLANEGISDDLRLAVIIYLISHNRPMYEILPGNPKDISREYERAFVGMTEEEVALDELYAARDAMIEDVIHKMPNEHREFLLSFEQGEPDWSLLGLENPEAVAVLPAVAWRQRNLDSLEGPARENLVENLRKALGL